MNKHKYLVDIPTVVLIWKRPEKQKKLFEVLQKARPSKIFLVSDGPRNDKEKELILESRKIVENIDWECEVHKIYEEKNIGMHAMFLKFAEYVFNHVDRCVIMEDDYVPSVSYFKFAAEMLEKYKDDERVLMVSGMNHFETSSDCSSDYFFAHNASIWGVGFWKRTYDKFFDDKFINDNYIKEKFAENELMIWNSGLSKNLFMDKFSQSYKTGLEYNLAVTQLLHNQLIIVPKKNLISNIGHGGDSTNSVELKIMPKRIRKIFNMKTYELNFPLQHPNYVLPDLEYSKNVRKLMGFGFPFVKLSAKLESFFYRIFH